MRSITKTLKRKMNAKQYNKLVQLNISITFE